MGTEHPDYQARFASGGTQAPGARPAAADPEDGRACCAWGCHFRGHTSRGRGADGIEHRRQLGDAGIWLDRAFAVRRLAGHHVRAYHVAVGGSSAAGGPRVDTHNPDRAMRSRVLVGVEIVRGVRQTAPGVWSDGALYNPDDGRTYAGSISLKEGSLELKGCAMGVFCQTQTWRRAADVVAAAGCVSR